MEDNLHETSNSYQLRTTFVICLFQKEKLPEVGVIKNKGVYEFFQHDLPLKGFPTEEKIRDMLDHFLITHVVERKDSYFLKFHVYKKKGPNFFCKTYVYIDYKSDIKLKKIDLFYLDTLLKKSISTEVRNFLLQIKDS